MNANMQQWAGEISAEAQIIAGIILTSDNSASDLRLLSSLLNSVRCTSDAMSKMIKEGATK